MTRSDLLAKARERLTYTGTPITPASVLAQVEDMIAATALREEAVPVIDRYGSAFCRTEIPTRTFEGGAIWVTGYYATGDCQSVLYVKGTSSGPNAIRDAGGTWWNLCHPGVVDPRWFGAKGDSQTSDSAAFNAAYAVCPHMRVGTGAFFQTAPVDVPPGGSLKGSNLGATALLRSSNAYGDTIQAGRRLSTYTITIVDPGIGYQVGNILTVQGGTFSQPARLQVMAVDAGGKITATTELGHGIYTTLPGNPTGSPGAKTPTLGGTGTGAKVRFDYEIQAAGPVQIADIWCWHKHEFAATPVTWASGVITNRVTNGSAHLRIIGGVLASVKRCRLWNMSYGIVWDACTAHCRADQVIAIGAWSASNAGMQEMVAGHRFMNGCQTIRTSQCSTGGGTIAATDAPPIGGGPRWCYWIQSGEGFTSDNDYFGGASENAIFLNPGNPNGWSDTLKAVEIRGPYLDGYGSGALIAVAAQGPVAVVGLHIHGAKAEGGGGTPHFLRIEPNSDPTIPSVTALRVHDNRGQDLISSPIVLLGVDEGVVHHNQFNGNVGGLNVNPLGAAGLYAAGTCKRIRSNHNQWGGEVNVPSAGPGNLKWGFFADVASAPEMSWDSYDEEWISPVAPGLTGGSAIYPQKQDVASAATATLPAGGRMFRFTGVTPIMGIAGAGGRDRFEFVSASSLTVLGAAITPNRLYQARLVDGTWRIGA